MPHRWLADLLLQGCVVSGLVSGLVLQNAALESLHHIAMLSQPGIQRKVAKGILTAPSHHVQLAARQIMGVRSHSLPPDMPMRAAHPRA